MGVLSEILKPIIAFFSNRLMSKSRRREKVQDHVRASLLTARDTAGWIKEQLLDAREFGADHDRIAKQIELLRDLQGKLAHLQRVQNALLLFRRSAVNVMRLIEQATGRDEMYQPNHLLERDYWRLIKELAEELR